MNACATERKPLFTTDPHGEHDVTLLEDAARRDDRIYEITDRHEKGSIIRILGSELASLCHWWAAEMEHSGKDEEDA